MGVNMKLCLNTPYDPENEDDPDEFLQMACGNFWEFTDAVNAVVPNDLRWSASDVWSSSRVSVALSVLEEASQNPTLFAKYESYFERMMKGFQRALDENCDVVFC